MKTFLSLLVLCSSWVQAQTLTLPGPLTLKISGINSAQQQQLRQSLTAELPQQWALLQDEQYWPAAQHFARTGQWPAHAALLQQAWQACEAWWQQQRSYHCRFGAARQVWRQASAAALPDRVQLRREARQITSQTGANVRLLPDLQAFAQAVLLDNLLATIRAKWPQASLNLQFGHWQAQFAAEAEDVAAFGKTDANPLTAIRLQQQVLLQANDLTTSGTDTVWYPAEAWPVQYGPAVAVTSQSFSRAWLLAQALTSASPTQRTLWLQQETDAALWREWQANPEATPRFQASTGWFHQLQAAEDYQQSRQLQLQLELPAHASQAKRPYVSAWLSHNGQWQAQLLLLGEQPRWYNELRSWWRQIGQQSQQNYDQLAGATRKPGLHQFVWNARLADGRPLPAGDYILHLEAAREGGGREQLKLPLYWPLTHPLVVQGQHELGQVRIDARPANATASEAARASVAAVHPSG